MKKNKLDYLTAKGRLRDKNLAREVGAKGNARIKELKTARETYKMLLDLKTPDKIKDKLKELMPNLPEDMTNRLALYTKTFLEAINGNMTAVKEITDRVDGLLKQEIDISGELDMDNKITVEFVKAKKE